MNPERAMPNRTGKMKLRPVQKIGMAAESGAIEESAGSIPNSV